MISMDIAFVNMNYSPNVNQRYLFEAEYMQTRFGNIGKIMK